MRIALAALLLAFAPPQEPKLDDLLDFMEKQAESLRDLSFKIEGRADRNMGMPRADVSVAYVRGSGLRIRARSEWGKEARAAGLVAPAAADTIYTSDRIRLIQEWDDRANAGPVGFLALAIRTDDPALKSHEHFFLPSGAYPQRMMYDEPLLYCRIAPRMFFALEPNLVYEGKRAEGTKTYQVLVSIPSPRDPKLPQPAYSVETRRKQFFVDPATGAVARLRWEITYRWKSGGSTGEQRTTFVVEPSGAQTVTETLTLPESVRWTQLVEGRNLGRGTEWVHTISALRANSGLGASEILSEPEKEDLYGDPISRPSSDYEARVKKDPKDAEAHYAFAQARGLEDSIARLMRGRPGTEKVEPAPVIAALEKAAELRPKAEGPALNLLSAYRAAGDDRREKEYLSKIEKSGSAGPRLRLRAAARLNAIGEVDRAAALLDGLAPASEEERRRAVLERLLVAAAKGDPARLSGLFAEEAAKRPATVEKVALVRAIETRVDGLPDAVRAKWTAEAAAALVEKGIKEHPGEIAFRIARAALLGAQGKLAASAAELLEAGPADAELVERALEQLDPVDRSGRFVVVGGAAPEPPAADTEGLPRLLAALGKVGKGDPRVEYQWGKALAASGKADEAGRKFEAALESCRGQLAGQRLHAAAMRVAFLLGAERPSEGWRDKCVEVILAIGKDSASIPIDLVYDETRNPISQAVSELFTQKEWLKAYRLSVAALRMGAGNYFLWRYRDVLKDEGVAAIKKEVFKEESSEKFVELADFLETLGNSQEVAEVLGKAVEKSPKDLDLLERLARKHGELGRAQMAEAAYEKLIPQVAADRRCGLRLELAQVFLDQKNPTKAKDVLGPIETKALDVATAIRCAEAWAQAQEWDRSIEACRRAYELGLKPHFLMGRCLEKKQDFYEALRYYNRDVAEGSSADGAIERKVRIMRQRSFRSGEPEGEAEPTTGQAARGRLLKKLGPDWLLKRFLDRSFEPLGGADEKKVKGSVEKLSSDDVADRDGGLEELRAFGSRAAPLLMPLLKSADDEVKTRVRQLFVEWAEPK